MKKLYTQSLFANSSTLMSQSYSCQDKERLNNRCFNRLRWITKPIIAVFFLMMLQNAQAQIICPCGVVIQSGTCPCHDVYKDADGDGFGNPAITQSIVNGDPIPPGFVANSTDCNDADNTIYPGAPELCDGKDNNCNGIIEELYYKDFDGDGLGDPNSSLINCGGQPAGYVNNKNDCNDSDPSIRKAVDWVKDADNDGRYVGSPVASCSSPGAGYVVKTTQKLGDCNDNDPVNSPIIYVKANAVGTHDGSSWANAFITLQDALANTVGCKNQIWVAAGTYYPDEGGGKTNNDVTASFGMKNGITIYGGFAGTETSLIQRNWKLYPTILSGDIDKDGTYVGNSNSVIHNNNINNTAVLDGFTITAGNFSFWQDGYGGGGMLNENSSPIMVNCIFSGNKAKNGGALCNNNSSPLIRDCSFIGNSADIDMSAQVPSGKGGAIYNYSGSLTTINCTFSKNTAANDGDVISNSGNIKMTNCILWGNGQALHDYYNNGTLTITYSLLQDVVSGTHNLNADPLFVNAATNDFRLQSGSPAINVGLDSVNKEILDLGWIPRKAGVIDMGAYEYQGTCNQYSWVKDADGDGYYAGSPVSQCTSPGDGYKIITTQQPGDCNDNDSTINPKTVWHLDADNDGYYDPNYIGLPSCTPPQDGKHYTIIAKGSDCNDNNAAQNPETIWVKDADGDGYYTGNIILGCLGQAGYKIRTNEVPGDCDDNDASVHPGATEILNGKDDNCDGQIDEGICGVATNLTATNITTNSATISWGAAPNATKYNLSYKADNVSTWTVVKNIKATTYNLTNLALYYSYHYKIQTVCPLNAKSAYSSAAQFTTSYGGPVYCATNGNTTYEYIDRVILGSAINNKSGDNNGYGNYFNLNATISPGGTYQIKLTPGFHFDPYTEFWEVYIDYNQDGIFKKQAGERVVTGRKSGTLSKTFIVPLTAKNGFTRMRVMMHYDSALNQPCGNFVDGEAEDYTVIITGGTAAVVASTGAEVSEDVHASTISSLLVIPNPVNTSSATAVLNMTRKGNASVRITDLSGRTLYKKEVTNLHTGRNSVALTGLASLTNGTYFIEAEQNGIIIGRAQVIVAR